MYILIIACVLVAGGFLVAFLFAVKSGQFEDDISPAVRILIEEKTINLNNKPETNNQNNATN
jgi:cbb3-type cytochrome oxidase maturation protein